MKVCFRFIKYCLFIFFVNWIACCVGFAILLYIFPALDFLFDLTIEWPTNTKLRRHFLVATWCAFLGASAHVFVDWYQNRKRRDF